MSSRKTSRARRRFIADQADAAAADVAEHVADSAHRTGRQVTDIGESKFGTVAGDELATWFIRAYIGAVTSGLSPCRDLHLRARRLLPARCGRCQTRAATLTLDIAYGDARLICHVCPACMATHSSRGGDVA